MPFTSPLLISHRVQSVKPIYAWMNGHPLENGKAVSVIRTPNKSDSIYPSYHLLPRASHSGAGLHELLPIPFGMLTGWILGRPPCCFEFLVAAAMA